VAAHNYNLFTGIQGLLMPALLLPGGSGGPSGSYSGVGLLDGVSFEEMAYTSLDSASSGTGTSALTGLTTPILSALMWAINPLSTTELATFTTNGNMTENVTTQ